MAHWVRITGALALATDTLSPASASSINRTLHRELLGQDVIYNDVTELQVLQEEGRTAAGFLLQWC